LVAIGEDPNREGLLETPERCARFWKEFIEHDPGKLATSFTSVQHDQLVVVRGIEVWSLCEHHLVPFSCQLTVGYIADDVVVGLSKIVRMCEKAAHRLQLQERLVLQVADMLEDVVGGNVGVVGTGQHLCMRMRGVKAHAAEAVTSVMRGVFLEKPEARAELLALHG
jgi:GTP cyclohydrolase I